MHFFGTLIVLLCFVLLLILVLLCVFRQKSSLIFGIYPRKGLFYDLKYFIALLLLRYLRATMYSEKATNEVSEALLAEMDAPQKLSDNDNNYDVVSFVASNKNGQKLKVTVERHRHGVMMTCFYIWLPSRGLLVSPNLPDMISFSTDGKSDNIEFLDNEFHIFPENHMSKWHLKYTGQLRVVAEDRLIQVKLHLIFNSSNSYFNYNRDLSSSVIADAVAREAWNDEFFKVLKSLKQILSRRLHFEQIGTLEGEVHLDDEILTLNMNALRDRSYGTERCLSTINRYVYFTLFLEDGTTMVIGNLSQPLFFLSSLKVGYVFSAQKGHYEPITSCNFELYSYGEKGKPPQHKNFLVETQTKKYFVQIQVQYDSVRYVGSDWQSKVFDQFASCTVNGVQGQAIGEYLYRYSGGRPNDFSYQDPEWYKRKCEYQRSLSQKGQDHEADDFDF